MSLALLENNSKQKTETENQNFLDVYDPPTPVHPHWLT